MKCRIMFVCLGNICRSPLAKAVFIHLVKKSNRSEAYEVDSSGTGAWHIGHDCDRRIRDVAEKKGIAMQHRAKQFTAKYGSQYDFIIVMDHDNLRTVRSLLPEEAHAKVHLLRSFDKTDHEEAVPDPYYGKADGFEAVYHMIHRACECLLETLEGTWFSDPLQSKGSST